MTALSTLRRPRTATGRFLLAAVAALSLAGHAARATTTTHQGGYPKQLKALDVDARSHEVLEIAGRLEEWRGVVAVALAPDGAHAALIMSTNELLLMDTATLQMTPIRSGLTRTARDSAPALGVHWVDAQHMVVDWGSEAVVMGLDGERGQRVGKRVVRMMRKPDGTIDDWAIVSADGVFDSRQLHRVNLRTGEESKVPVGLDGKVFKLVFDRRGRLRAALTRDSGWFAPGAALKVWYRHDDAAAWQMVQSVPVSAYEDGWQLVGVDDEADQLLVVSREGRDTWALFHYDPVAHKLGELVVGDADVDLETVTMAEPGMPLHVVTGGLKSTTRWLDPRWERVQRAVDQALPTTVNELADAANGLVLIHAYSDRDPGQWLMLDTRRKKLVPLGRRSVTVEPDAMRPVQTLAYDAADGLKIPAYLTLPDGPAVPRPMVVLMDGGPFVRSRWGFDSDVQLFAAAGYAVFQPQFRGSTGFGRAFEQAGYRQWGLAMQDDITAGVKAMIARGVADPDRICVYGVSYGGYAAMWGLAKTPELYKCGVSLAGVSDIGAMFADWSDVNDDDQAREVMRFRVGDPATMKAGFDAVSPVLHADRIRVPVLIGHNTGDRQVPVGHAERLESALEAAHLPVDAHFYRELGHRLSYRVDREHFDTLAVTFVDRAIGPASPFKDRWVPVPVRSAASAASAASAP